MFSFVVSGGQGVDVCCLVQGNYIMLYVVYSGKVLNFRSMYMKYVCKKVKI